MRTPPDGLELAVLAESLLQGWGIRVTRCEYVPVGGGSHHWRLLDADSTAHWVTVDDLGRRPLDGLRTALDTACGLRDDCRLEFVVAPVRTPAGEALRPLGSRFAVALYPYLEAPALTFGEDLDELTAIELATLLARLHGADPAGASRLPEVGAELPARSDLELALRELGTPWTGGPFSEPAREAVAGQQRAIRQLLRLFDELQPAASESVVTHGEPHPANVITAGGRPLLIDWDTVARAAPERDLWWLGGRPAALEAYERVSSRGLDPVRLRLYRVRWTLDDIASFVRMFRSPHERNPDTERWWSFASRLSRAAETAAQARRSRTGSRSGRRF